MHTYKYNVSMTKKTMFYIFSTYPTYGDRVFEGCLGSWAQANIDCGSILVGGMETRARRPAQDYTRAAYMLSEAVWAQLQRSDLATTAKAERVFERCYQLGLRLPFESTFACLTALVCCYDSVKRSSFEMHELLSTVKARWRSWIRKRESPATRLGRLRTLAALIPLRVTHSSARAAQGSEAGTGAVRARDPSFGSERRPAPLAFGSSSGDAILRGYAVRARAGVFGHGVGRGCASGAGERSH